MTEPDDRIAALFRAAADTAAPAPGFDHDAVVARSRRVTARRRSALLGGAVALLVVAGVGVAALPRGIDSPTSAAAPAAGPAEEAAPERAGDAAGAAPFAASESPGAATPPPPTGSPPPTDSSVPEALRDSPPFTGTPLGPGTAPCADRQDPELRAFVEEVLPEVAGAPELGVTTECRPAGERGVALEVDDGGTTGILTVDYLPPGEVADVPGALSARTASGGTVVVRSQGRGGVVPFEGRLDTLVAHLVPRL